MSPAMRRAAKVALYIFATILAAPVVFPVLVIAGSGLAGMFR